MREILEEMEKLNKKSESILSHILEQISKK